MNCKPGDLAVFVRCAYAENIGKLVRIISNYRCDPGEWFIEPLSRLSTNRGHVQAGERVWADDMDLRPIRDSDGEDETLTWAGKPQCVPA